MGVFRWLLLTAHVLPHSNGHLTTYDDDQTVFTEVKPLGADNTLLRGCVLRNVDYIYGIVIYTGNETKVHTASVVWLSACLNTSCLLSGCRRRCV